MTRIGVLVSGGGTNLQALIDRIEDGTISNGGIVSVISSRPGVYALERARKHNIKNSVVSRKEYSTSDGFDNALLKALQEDEVDLIVLAGFLSILGPKLLKAYHNRILNVHPSLIPSFCGDGFYGLKVHKAALDYGVKVTGATVHLVNEVTDGGKILLQKAVEVIEGDTPETLQKRVMEQAEWVLLPEAVNMYCNGEIE